MTAVSESVEIRVLSVRHPFAQHLIYPHSMLGPKWVENRSWITKYRGTLFIHASRWEAKPSPDECDQPVDELWNPAGPTPVVGAIIGSVELIASAGQHDVEECYDVMNGQSRRKLTADQAALRELLPDPKTKAGENAWLWYGGDGALIVRDPRALREPIEIGGKLNIWKHHVDPNRLVYRD